ncbi:hypothetical protein [Candidatus Berkiella aquae]|uniref:Uncharacterized protein n=1 Tax=Candidatus Berkiella aquae TaxID=295108 RepID=A0A0Q9Z1T3_9GAMM|nr:hypothetical protein [Candidatus Berkiella aquae]MCS5712364.1 hypothetical protein [Candidatus Berkiella aquae]
MKLLNLENCQKVSGGDVNVSVSANVPTENTDQFVHLLGMLLTGQLNAKVLGAILDNEADSFNNMPIDKITIGNFQITHI